MALVYETMVDRRRLALLAFDAMMIRGNDSHQYHCPTGGFEPTPIRLNQHHVDCTRHLAEVHLLKILKKNANKLINNYLNE